MDVFRCDCCFLLFCVCVFVVHWNNWHPFIPSTWIKRPWGLTPLWLCPAAYLQRPFEWSSSKRSPFFSCESILRAAGISIVWIIEKDLHSLYPNELLWKINALCSCSIRPQNDGISLKNSVHSGRGRSHSLIRSQLCWTLFWDSFLSVVRLICYISHSPSFMDERKVHFCRLTIQVLLCKMSWKSS